MHFGILGQRGAAHVAIYITAGSEGIQQSVVDALHRRAQIPFQHTMQLDGLTGRQTQLAVAVVCGNLLQGEPLGWRADAGGHPSANHEAVVRLQFLFGALNARLAIVLLIDAVEFRNLGVVGRNRSGHGVSQALRQGAAQVSAARLDVLDFRHRFVAGIAHGSDVSNRRRADSGPES